MNLFALHKHRYNLVCLRHNRVVANPHTALSYLIPYATDYSMTSLYPFYLRFAYSSGFYTNIDR